VCRLWVIPKVLHLEMELQQLNDLGSLVDFPVAVQNKSGYGRLGADMICVRALLENPGATRKGVIYLILDGRQTLMIVGLAAGSNVSNLQTLLDNSVRTIQRASAPEKK
jgi:hypothetical protein